MVLCVGKIFAAEGFIVKESGKILKNDGDYNLRLTPGCDFSIFLSIVGFDSGILKNAHQPEWPYKDGYEKFLNVWKKPHIPRTWIVDSCVWYSGNIVEKVGFDKIQDYINKFEFGNQNAAGINRHDWPGAVLISANEYVDFLQKLVDKKLPVSAHALEMTEEILYIQDLIGGWKLYGKTGVGEGAGEERIGWFVGWISKGNRSIPFASYVLYSKKPENIPSFVARSRAMEKLFWLINDFEEL